MTYTDIVNLIGLKSTDPKIAIWFETHNLGKPPKSINSNQSTKGATDRANSLSYYFAFEIKHEDFYPPVSPKKDDYNFESYLKSVVLFEKPRKKDIKDTKPVSFWDDAINPNSTYKECCTFFNNEGKQTEYSIFFSKALNEIVKLKVWMTVDKAQVTSIELCINEESEIVSYVFFREQNEHNTVKQAYLLLVKWLFDNRFLLLTDDVYLKGLTLANDDIRAFVSSNLRNHIWDNQITTTPHLRSFLFSITSSNTIPDKNGEKINLYIKDVYLKHSAQWDEWQKNYNNENDDDRFPKLEVLERSISLNKQQAEAFLNRLTALFVLFCEYEKQKLNV